MEADAPFELFHLIAEAPSARVRRYVVDHYLEDRVRFRNVAFEDAQRALKDHGGTGRVPALWDGQALHTGAEACIARLQTLTNIGRAP